MENFLIARNPDPDSTLPYLVRIPLGDGIVLRARETWPRTAKVYCHRAGDVWPADPEVVLDVPIRSVTRRGAAIDLVLDRARENRSQFVLTMARGREMVFWQSARTSKTARPNVALPKARAAGLERLEIVVDTRERYAWKFTHQQVVTTPGALPCGDYAVRVDDEIVAAVERKSLGDLLTSLTGGRLRSELSELAALPHAAVVVEDRYSAIFRPSPGNPVRPALIADMLAELQVHFPHVPVHFAENRSLAQEWTYRFLGAAVSERTLGVIVAGGWGSDTNEP